MDKNEAHTVLKQQLERYRELSYAELVRLLGEPDVFEFAGLSGVTYQIEIEAVWDRTTGGDLRIIGSIDDGTLLRSMSPLCDDFIISADGTFIGE